MSTANTNTDPSWQGVSLNEAIRVNKHADRLSAGSCNACTNGVYATNVDNGKDMVTEVQLRGMSFRLCVQCRVILKGLL